MAVSEHQELVTKYPVFISFRGADVRTGFLSFLEDGLEKGTVKYYVDSKELRGEVLDILLERIQESRLVLIILSQNFMESSWCIKELLHITKEMIGSRPKIIPIFYKVKARDVKGWKIGEQARGDEGEEEVKKREKEVTEALKNLTTHMGLKSSDYRTDCDFVKDIVKEVQRLMASIKLKEEKEKTSVETWDRWEREKEDMSWITRTGKGDELETTQEVNFFGIKQRLQNLQEMLGMGRDNSNETRVVGVLGMPGIGKTTLAEKLFEEERENFHRRMFIKDIQRTSKEKGPAELRVRLLKKLLKKANTKITEETTHESVEKELLDSKVFGDGFPVRYGNHENRGRGETSSMANNTKKKPNKSSKSNLEFTGTNGWIS